MTDQAATAPANRRLPNLLAVAASMELLVLLATGIALFFWYRPAPDESLGALLRPGSGSPAAAISVVRGVHRLATYLAGATLLGLVVERALSAPTPSRRIRRVGAGALCGVLLAIVAALGTAVAWDQMALWAVSLDGYDLDGFQQLWGDEARFLLIDGAEVGLDTVSFRLLAHIAGGLGLGLLLVVSVRSTRRGRPRDVRGVNGPGTQQAGPYGPA